MKHVLLFSLLFILNTNLLAQRTTVRSYYRKDGTHVNGYTRSYKSGAGRAGSGGYSIQTDDEEIPISEGLLAINQSAAASKGTFHYQGSYWTADFVSSPAKAVEGSDTTALPLYISVLRYNGTIINICPVGKSLSDYDYDFRLGTVYHKINRKQITAEQVVELISSCDFKLVGDDLQLFMPMSSSKRMTEKINKTPFLKHTFEVMYIK